MPPVLAIILAVLSSFITLLTVVVGVAVLWGKFTTMMGVIGKEVDRLREIVDEQKEMHASFREDVLVRFAEVGSQSRGLGNRR